MKKQFDFDKIQSTKRLIELNKLIDEQILIAVSGGIDSVVLAHHLVRVYGRLKNKHGYLSKDRGSKKLNQESLPLVIAHFHHGLTSNKKTNAFRKKAQTLTRKLAQDLRIPFFTNKPKKISTKQSEESLREARTQFFKEICEKQNIPVIAKAHHQEDLLETRLIRLIRGVGGEGFTSMQAFETNNFRPLLTWKKEEVLEYAKKEKLVFVTDPSNKDEKYLRNWIRHHWLESLEKKRPGARSSLTKSLENLAQELSQKSARESELEQLICDNKILKMPLLVLHKSEQRRVLARYLNQMRVKNYTSTQIDEILKRLDKSQKEFTFTVANCLWTVDTRHIFALRLSSSS